MSLISILILGCLVYSVYSADLTERDDSGSIINDKDSILAAVDNPEVVIPVLDNLLQNIILAAIKSQNLIG